MTTLKARAVRTLAAAAVIGGAAIAATGTAAQAAPTWYNHTDINCYNFHVIISSRTTAVTEHWHHVPNGGGAQKWAWNNGPTNTYRISSQATALTLAEVRTTGYRTAASRFCDH